MSRVRKSAERALDGAFRDELQQLFSYFLHHADGDAAIEQLGSNMKRLIGARSMIARLIAEADHDLGETDQPRVNAALV